MSMKTCRDCDNDFDPAPVIERLEQLKAEGKIEEVWPPTRCRDCGLKLKEQRAREKGETFNSRPPRVEDPRFPNY